MSKKYVLLDLEATCCDDGSIPKHEAEIIEIGAAIVDENMSVLATYSEFVRPVKHPVLHPFCTQLTTITQSDVDEADTFGTVSKRFESWLALHQPTWYGSWGEYDRKQLGRDAELWGIAHSMGELSFLNIKSIFSQCAGIRKGKGMKKAMRMLKVESEGTQHRAMVDVMNMITIVKCQPGMIEFLSEFEV